MASKRPSKRILKITAFVTGFLLVAVTIFHFWFINHAKTLLENIVTTKSHGRLKLEVRKFHFNYFSTKMVIDDAVFYNTDTATQSTAYRFTVHRIRLKVPSIFPIIFSKQFLINSLSLEEPTVVITRLRGTDKTDSASKQNISIPREMGKIYQSIQDAIEVLEVKKFDIDSASVTFINKTQPAQPPTTINNIFFHIDNLQVSNNKPAGENKILFADNAVLRTHNQDILFPDGRHRLTFSRFSINLKSQLVEFDSCTIAAIKTDSTDASFKVFFDVLLLTHIDFDTLYKHDVIKADSVACINPSFELDATMGKPANKGIKPPKLEKIIQQLTGDLQLGFVVVTNASFDINITRNDKPSSFTSDHNNFAMTGFSIDQDAANPVAIKSFAMAIRNYENFLRDSSYFMQFDSILLNNHRIFLSNFSFRQLDDRGKTANSFAMPEFELQGLNWDELVFNHRLQATEATLYHPVIDYSALRIPSPRKKKQKMFDLLSSLDSVVEIDRLNIEKGKINIRLKNNLQLKLDDASLSVQSGPLLRSRKIPALEQAIDHLRFKKGFLHAGDLSFDLSDMSYTGNGGYLLAGAARIQNSEKTLSADIQKLSAHEVTTDDKTGNVRAKDIQWEKADLDFVAGGGSSSGEHGPVIDLTEIKGANTTLHAHLGDKLLNTFIKNFSLAGVIKKPGEKIKIVGPAANGDHLSYTDSATTLTIGEYHFASHTPSSFRNVQYHSYTPTDSVTFTTPQLSLVPDMNAILAGIIKMDNVVALKPALKIKLSAPDSTNKKASLRLPALVINKIDLQQPQISLVYIKGGKMSSFAWNGQAENNNRLEISGIVTGKKPAKIAADDIRLQMNHFIYSGSNGKTFNADQGEITINLKEALAQELSEGNPWSWSFLATDLDARKFHADSLGKSAGRLDLDQLHVQNFYLSAASLGKLALMHAENPRLVMNGFTGQYNTTDDHLAWFNAGYNQLNKVFTVDSFNYQPTRDTSAFMKHLKYRTDYTQLNTGKILIDGIDLSHYFKDSALHIHTIHINDLVLFDFLDLHIPIKPGTIKLLPVRLIQKIPFKISIDSLLFKKANASYTEFNDKTNKKGTIPVSKLELAFYPVRNYELGANDSLHIHAKGQLMDSIDVNLHVHESYTDTLSGFLMTLQVKPTNLLQLNPVLEPLASIQLLSGYLDTLTMRAVGREYLSFGDMKMFYHDLKLKFLKDGSEKKKGLLQGLVTYIVTHFIIKKKNDSRTGTVFFVRLRDRSSINYLLKMLLSGVSSSAGIKPDRKIRRQYKKELQSRNLPPVNYD